MEEWIRFSHRRPDQGQFIVAITQIDPDANVEAWEGVLEKNAVGIWIDGDVWVGNTAFRGFTHWLELPDRPLPGDTSQLSLGDWFRDHS
jgi:hypothetical protein